MILGLNIGFLALVICTVALTGNLSWLILLGPTLLFPPSSNRWIYIRRYGFGVIIIALGSVFMRSISDLIYVIVISAVWSILDQFLTSRLPMGRGDQLTILKTLRKDFKINALQSSDSSAHSPANPIESALYQVFPFKWDIKNNHLEVTPAFNLHFALDPKLVNIPFSIWEACFDLVDEREEMVRLFHEALLRRKSISGYFYLSRNDVTSHFKICADYIESESKNPIGYAGYIIQLTEEIKQIKELKAYANQLEDVTTRRDWQIQELTQQHQRDNLLLETISQLGKIGSWYLHLPSKRVQWSDEVFKIHELPPGEIPPFDDLILFYAPEARGVILDCLKKAEEEEKAFDIELPLLTHQKNWIWVKTKGQPVIKNGNVTGIQGIFQEISQEKQKRENLVAINEKLDRENKMLSENTNRLLEDFEKFSYLVSHDLRAPLRSIQGFSQALSEAYKQELGEEGMRWLRYIESNTLQMEELLMAILSYSRVERSFVQPIELDMNRMVSEAFDKYKVNYSDHIIKLNVEKLPKIKADKILMSYIWNALIDNALKFSSTNKEIQIEINGRIEDDFGVFSIRDNGIGFDVRYEEKLYAVFQKVHSESFGGSGVGLALVDKAIRKHDGWIRAESELNKGSTFTFGIPVI